MNLHYCVFRSTLSDLLQCYYEIGNDNLSEEENKARDALIEICKKIIEKVE